MPQATEELRARMEARFGDPIDDGPPWAYLTAAGYSSDRFIIRKPSPYHVVTREEGECIDFLCDEWDWDYQP